MMKRILSVFVAFSILVSMSVTIGAVEESADNSFSIRDLKFLKLNTETSSYEEIDALTAGTIKAEATISINSNEGKGAMLALACYEGNTISGIGLGKVTKSENSEYYGTTNVLSASIDVAEVTANTAVRAFFWSDLEQNPIMKQSVPLRSVSNNADVLSFSFYKSTYGENGPVTGYILDKLEYPLFDAFDNDRKYTQDSNNKNTINTENKIVFFQNLAVHSSIAGVTTTVTVSENASNVQYATGGSAFSNMTRQGDTNTWTFYGNPYAQAAGSCYIKVIAADGVTEKTYVVKRVTYSYSTGESLDYIIGDFSGLNLESDTLDLTTLNEAITGGVISFSLSSGSAVLSKANEGGAIKLLNTASDGTTIRFPASGTFLNIYKVLTISTVPYSKIGFDLCFEEPADAEIEDGTKIFVLTYGGSADISAIYRTGGYIDLYALQRGYVNSVSDLSVANHGYIGTVNAGEPFTIDLISRLSSGGASSGTSTIKRTDDTGYYIWNGSDEITYYSTDIASATEGSGTWYTKNESGEYAEAVAPTEYTPSKWADSGTPENKWVTHIENYYVLNGVVAAPSATGAFAV